MKVRIALTGVLAAVIAAAVPSAAHAAPTDDKGPAQAPPRSSTATLVAPGTGSPGLEADRRRLAKHIGTAAAGVLCWNDVEVYAHANGTYVSAEMASPYTGSRATMLRARAEFPGPWEKFAVCRDTDTGITNIRSRANDRLVAAEAAYAGNDYGMLRARTPVDVGGPWEIFITDNPPGTNGTYNAVYLYATSTSRYVSAEIGFPGIDYGMLRARAEQPGPWEIFVW